MTTLLKYTSLLILIPSCYAATAITSDSTGWTAIGYSGANEYDYLRDEQANSAEGDIVGNASNPGLLMCFDDNATPMDTSDDTISYRVRLAGGSGGYSNTFFLGVDLGEDSDVNGEADGDLDFFIGISAQPNPDVMGIFANTGGIGDNISPSTTSIGAISATYQQVWNQGVNFDFRAVTGADGGDTTDIDSASGRNPASGVDYYLSFSLPFDFIINYAADPSTLGGIVNIDSSTVISYVASTATQVNSLNQDLLGANGIGSGTWAELGVVSDPITFGGSTPVPEPSTTLFTLIGSAFLLGRRRRH